MNPEPVERPDPNAQEVPHPKLRVKFVIIGGGLAGLACALALRRVGHSVVVLERESRAAARGRGGVRLSPNLSKILFHWGLREAMMSRAGLTKRLLLLEYETGEDFGTHEWDEEMLKESRGMLLMLVHGDLHDMLHDAAVERGAEVLYNTEVTELDTAAHKVVLASGSEVSGDVFVGADGEFGISRVEIVGDKAHGVRTGAAIYDSIVASKHAPEYAAMLQENHAQFIVVGRGRAMLSYSIDGAEKIGVQVYSQDEGQDGRFGDPPTVDFQHIAGPTVSEKLHPAVHNAERAVRIAVRDHEDLESWVSSDGRLVLIGEAAHPFPPSSAQGTAMAIEDAAVLAKLFSHLLERRQIPNFLYAFQELREERVSKARARDLKSLFMIMSDGPSADERDAGFRLMQDLGRNAFDSGDMEDMWDEYRVMFGYECEDEADDWWVNWGLLRERALQKACSHGGDAGEAESRAQLDFWAAVTSTTVSITND